MHLAVAHRIDLGVNPWLLVDVGGGSVEVTLADAQGIRWAESHAMGSVRLLEDLTSNDEEPGRFLRLLEEYVSTLRIPRTQTDRPVGYAATGGNVESLARLANALPDAAGVARLPMADLRRLIELLAITPFHQRVQTMGLRPDRADVILPAAIIYERLGKMANVSEIHVPHVGLKDGILLDLANHHATRDADALLDAQAQQAAISLGRKYQFDEAHARHVTMLALSIFDQTRSLHELGADSRRILRAATLLHEIGGFVNQAGHHRHSLYLIAASGLLGFSPEELLVVANVARYHRKAAPKPEHEWFQQLSKPDRDRTLKLSAIMRLADALDRDHMQRVRGVKLRDERNTLYLLADSTGDLLLESWSLKRRSDLFKLVFGKKVVLETSIPVAGALV